MELRGHIVPPTPGTYSPAGAAAGRLQELRERQRSLRQALGLRLRELRRLCLQEAELTGKLPPEYPLEPGERPQPPPRRRTGGTSRGPLPEASRAARREVAVQLQVVEAARRLATAPGLPPEQRRRRQRLQAEAAQRLRQLRAQLDENGSLCDLPTLENGVLPHPKPPRAGPGSPDRRPPPPWTPETPGGGPGRRSSLASPASPARTLPRSASSFEGRSVPATPILPRSPRGGPLCRSDTSGLPPRPWSGSQDSQLGTGMGGGGGGGGGLGMGGVASPPPPTPLSLSPLTSGPPPPPFPAPPPRSRRSNSSEALIDWGGGGAGSETPPQSGGGGGGGGSETIWGGGPEAPRGLGGGGGGGQQQRRSQKWLALEGLRDWYLRHTGAPPPPQGPLPHSKPTPPHSLGGSSWVVSPPPPPPPPLLLPPPPPPPLPSSSSSQQRRRDPPGGLPHSLSYAGVLSPRLSGDPPTAPPDPQPPGTLV